MPCRAFFLCAMLLLLTRETSGQVLYGSIVGNVSDETNAIVPRAIVKIVHLESNQAREFETTEAGSYIFSSVPAGTYVVTVTKEGFQTFSARNIAVEANSVVRVNASLRVGAVSQSVDVTAQTSALQTDRADVRTEITSQSLQNIPVTGRSYQSLL